MDRIAVLLPLYKGDNAAWFKQSLASVLNQVNCKPDIFIGVDGPVGPDILKVLNEYEDNHQVHITSFPMNRGLACVLNDLLKIVKEQNYSFIARMDADDISVPERFTIQLSYMLSHPEVDVVGCNIEEIDEESRSKGKIISYPLNHDECYRHFRYRDPLAHPGVMFRNSFFQKVKGYREEYRKNQDTMLWYDGFLNNCRFANVGEVLLQFRVTEDFYKRRNGLKRAKQMLGTRFKINKALNYDISSYVFAILMFLMTISPQFIKKILYRVRK